MAISSQPTSAASGFICLPALWADVDGAQDAERFDGLPIPPSIVVNSGGGLHAYWLLAQPADITTAAARQRARDVLLALARACDGDPQVCDVSRVMRLPGSVNRKPQYAPDYPPARVIACNGERHAFEALRDAFAMWLPLPTPQPTRAIPAVSGRQPIPRWVDDYLSTGAAAGVRNRTLFRAACSLRAVGWDELAINSLLAPRGRADGLSEHEIAAALRSACRYEAARVPRHLLRIAALEDSRD